VMRTRLTAPYSPRKRKASYWGISPKIGYCRTIKVERWFRISLNIDSTVSLIAMMDNAKMQPPHEGVRTDTLGQLPRPVAREAPVWAVVPDGWRHLYGGFYDAGVSVEWHDFKNGKTFEWSRSFHPESLELCLNLAGRGRIQSRTGTADFEDRTAGFYCPGKGELKALRRPGEHHRFMTIEFSAQYLRRHLAACDGALHPLVEAFVQGGSQTVGVARPLPLTVEQERLIEQMQHPPVPQGAHSLWYQSKVLQLIVDFCFARAESEELFCDRQKRLARERVSRVVDLLRQKLSEPPSLEEIGRVVGCSPFYLSRTFSREVGMTIPQYLRKLRMERAAELLRTGRYNVTEAALEVGYSSLSHFSQAFCQTIGCCPALYPLGLKQASSEASAKPISTDPQTPARSQIERNVH